MKFLVVLALIAMAMAEPEADAQLLYRTYGYNNGYYPYTYAGYHPYTPYTYHYGKREAEAEPEADPALIYTTNTLPLTSAVHHSPLVSPLVSTTGVHQPIIYNSAVQSPVVYKTIPVAEKTEKVSTPVVYTHALPLHKPVVYNSAVQTPLIYNSALQTPLTYTVPRVYNTALTTPVLSKVFPSLKTLTTTPVVSHIAKREAEAEADPTLVYGVHQPIVYNTAAHTPLVYKTPVQTPVVYNTAVHTPLVYKTPVHTPLVYNTAVPAAVHTPLLKTVDHGVVPTVGGYIHSSHVGLCVNNLGVRVEC